MAHKLSIIEMIRTMRRRLQSKRFRSMGCLSILVLALVLALPASHAGAATTLYRSVGTKAAALATGKPTVVGVDTVSSNSGTGSTITVSHTTSGTNRLMLVGISGKGDSLAVSGVTYGGVPLTRVGANENTSWQKIWIYKLLAPATGTANVVVTFSDAPEWGGVVGVTTFTGVDQTNPLGTFATNNGWGSTASVNVSSAAGELVFDTFATAIVSATAGAGQTQRWNDATYSVRGAGTTKPGAASVTMSWTLTEETWHIGAVPIKPASPHLDAVSTGFGDNVSSITVSHTTSGTNRLMLVGISAVHSTGSYPVVSGVTYNAAPLTLVGSRERTDNMKVWIYRLVAPDTGTHDVVVSFSTVPDWGAVVGVTTFTGVDQSTPLGTFASADAHTNTPTVDVSSNTGQLVFDTLWTWQYLTVTVGAGQTERWNILGNDSTIGAGSTQPGAATVNMSWTLDTAADWILGAVPIRGVESETHNGLTISGSTATFDSGLTENIGVGDVIQYDSDNNGSIDALAFIHGRTSSTVYTVKDKNGNAPTATQAEDIDWTIYRAYTSLSNWATQAENSNITEPTENDVNPSTDLVSTDTVMMVACYGDGADTEAVSISSGWTTGADNYIKIYTPVSTTEVGITQRHSGKWDDTKYRLTPTLSSYGAGAIDIRAKSVRIEGLQVLVNSTDTDAGGIFGNARYIPDNGDLWISNNIVMGGSVPGDWAVGIIVWSTASVTKNLTARIWNNIVYGFDDSNGGGIFIGYNCSPTAYVYNNTVYDCYWGYYQSDYSGTPVFVAKNNISYNTADNYYGTFDTASTNNLSGPTQSDAPGSNKRNAVTVTFVNASGDDFHLASGDAGAKNYGADLSSDTNLPFSDDIDDQNRGSGSWDIGADECDMYTITASAGTGGSITPSGAVSVSKGTDVGFAITADTGYVISDVVVDGTSEGAVTTYTFTNVTEDHTIHASFSSLTTHYTLTASAGTGGSISPSGAVSVEEGANQGFTITSDTGYTVADVVVDGSSVGAVTTYTFTNVTADHSITATFDEAGATPTLYRSVGTYAGDLNAVNRASSGSTGGISLTIPHATIGSNRLMLVGVSLNNNDYETVTGVTYNGVPLTCVGTRANDNDARVEIWSLIAPDIGAHDVVITFSRDLAQDAIAGVMTFTGVDQTTPLGTFASAIGNDSTPAAVAVSSAAGEFVFGVVSAEYESVTTGSGQTEHWNMSIPGDGDTSGAGATKPGAAPTVTTSWTIDPDYNHWAAGGVSIKPAGVGGFPFPEANTVEISGTTATFSGAMPAYVGVGDALTYNSGGNRLAFIHERISSTVFTVRDKNGGTPTAAPAGTAVGVYRAYTSLANWESQTENPNITEPTENDVNPSTDLVSANHVMMVPCYADGPDTTAVTISGWTTGSGNYIKIYTPVSTSEVGTTQRHSGVWDTSKYVLSTNDTAIYMEENTVKHVHIDGLQIEVDSWDYTGGIYFYDGSGTVNFRVSNNIIRDVSGSSAHQRGIYVAWNWSGGETRIWNNIIYGFNEASDFGIMTDNGYIPHYVYNNTIRDCTYGIYSVWGTTTRAKNNLVQDCTTSCYATGEGWHSNSTNNCSDDGTHPGGSGQTGEVTFNNETGTPPDLHLDSTDSVARGNGADLHTEFFDDDIDGEARSGDWDIGADECHTGGETWHTISAAAGSGGSITPSGPVSVIEGADQGFTIAPDTGYVVADVVVDGSSVGAVTTYTFTNVTADHSITATFTETGAATATLYRSVGTNASNLNTSNRTVTISGSTATFSGSMPADVGVGDALTYNSGENRLAFIHGRTSSTVFTVRDRDGNEPTAASAGTAVGVYRAYTSLANWESQTENPNITEPTENDVNPSTNLVSANTVIMVACYADGVDTTGLSIDGWITGPENYIRIYTPTSSSQVGISQRHTGTAGTGYRIDPDTNGIRIGESYTQIEGLEVFDFGESGYSTCGIRIYGAYAHSCTISYCLIHSEVSDNGGAAIAMDPYGSFSNNRIFNNIIYDVYYGIGVDIGPQDTYVYNNTVVDCSLGIYSDESVIAKNNIAYNNAENYSGTFESASTNNLSGPTQEDAPGSNKRNAVTVTFVNATGDNFHLAESDTGARGYGADLSSDPDLPLSFDIDGDTRSGTWDIGADEYDVGGATYTITAVSGPGGSITPSGAVSVSEGGEATFTITPDTGYVITDVVVDGTSVHAVSSYTFTNVDADHTIVASFGPTPTYTITVNQASGGVISPGGTVTVTQGADQTFLIVPATGYAVANVLVDGVSVGAVTSYTFINIHADHTITAVFEEAPTFTITASAETYGSISPEGEVVLNWGGSETFTITPDPGYGVADVLVDGVSVGAMTLYAFSNVTADHTIVASFIAGGQHTIIAVAESGGSISPSGTITLNQGQSQTFTITPDAGNSVSDVEVDGVSVGAVTTYTFSSVSSGHVIVASFNVAADDCVDLASVPLGSLIHPGPPNIMFVLDDSGSMDAETLTQGEEEGYFYADGSDYMYVFDDPGDNIYDNLLPTEYRGLWKSQWWGYNKLYYNSSLEYEPWAGLPDANPDTPRSHPYYDYDYFNLNATYWKPGEKIVDDYDYGFSRPAGTWSEKWSSEAYNERYFQTSEIGVQHKARWNPHPNLTPGYYYVYAWWRDTSSYSTSVQYKIYYNVGPGDSTTATTSVYVNQEQNCAQWNQLGSNYYWFGGYDGNKIELIHTPSDDSNHACADAVMFVPKDAIDVKNAHYYTFDDTNGNGDYDTGEPVYLVVIEKIDPDIPPDAPEAENNYNIVYYLATITGSGQAEKVTNLVEVPEASVPPSVKSGRSGYEERQNFANWYSFYRRRTFAATSAVTKFILEMQGVQIGFYSIHQRVVQPVLKVKVAGVDETDQLLDLIYSMRVDGMTPLRQGLEAVGRYFHQDDGETGGIGDSPFVSSINGGECQQAFAIVMTDGYWNGDDPLGSIGNADSDNGDPYADDYSNTLADIAMYYYENDLADGLADKVPTIPSVDEAAHQHMVTYGVAFGVYGTLDPGDYNLKDGPYPPWPNVYEGYSDSRKIDDLWHAAVNGRGAFLSAGDPDELVTGLRNIMQNIESRIASASAISVNGDELYGMVGTDILMFQSTYNPDGWSGDVRAYQLDTASGQVLRESYIWSAAEKLNTMNWTTRKIATWDDIAMIGRDLDFNKLTPVQKTYINSDLTILNFLKGDRTTEVQFGGSFRNRFGVLGDIVHSSPIFQGYASGDGYLFVGANDGMLHCLDAATGVEVFAYVPNLVFPNLAALVDPDYGQSHEYYVDLSPTLQRGVDTGVSTKTLLVGGLGGGGKGYYALDVTDPDDWTSGPDVATKVMWEFGNDPDLGYSYCRPVIVDSNDEDINSHTGWVVIIGNGYNSQNGNAVLLILDPFDGHVLKRIDVGNGPCNALSAPTAVDSNADGKVDYVYAGDLKGNLWKFDLTDSNSANWQVAYKDGAANPKPLFRCPGQPITAQPDVMVHCEKHGYLVIFGTGKYLGESDFSDTSLQSIYGVWDYGDDDDNSEYLGTFTRGATPELSNQPDSVTLVRQTFLPSAEADPHFWTVGDNKVRILTNNNPIWTTTSYDSGGECGEGEGEVGCDPNGIGDKPDPIEHAGWYFDLPVQGERVISDVMIREQKVIVLSFLGEFDPCGSGGKTVIHEMDACSGGRIEKAGLPDPQFDIDDSDSLGTGDLVNIGTEEDPVWVAPSGLVAEGRLQPPAILSLGDQAGDEMKYYSSSSGDIEARRGPGVTIGLSHWREYR